MVSGFSVLISVYQFDNPFYLSEALQSILMQTVLPSEMVIIQDGPVPKSVNQTVENFYSSNKDKFDIKIIQLEKNVGLGEALRIGVELCNHNIIIRMDSDDICKIDRFEKLIKFIELNPKYTIVGSSIEEFCDRPGDLNKFRVLPVEGIELYQYSKFRNPINHPSIAFRKEEILKIGNYRSDLRFFEDYAFAINVLNSNELIYNLSEPLLHFRVGENYKSVKRRHGLNYLIFEIRFLIYGFKIGHFNKLETLINLIMKLPLRILPFSVLKFIYHKFLRQKS